MQRSISPQALQSQLAGKYVLDVRRLAALAASSERLPGAVWMNPERVDDWLGGMPRDRDIVVYCVHGESISNMVVDRLHAEGCRARLIEGGIEGWIAAGGATEPRP